MTVRLIIYEPQKQFLILLKLHMHYIEFDFC